MAAILPYLQSIQYVALISMQASVEWMLQITMHCNIFYNVVGIKVCHLPPEQFRVLLCGCVCVESLPCFCRLRCELPQEMREAHAPSVWRQPETHCRSFVLSKER